MGGHGRPSEALAVSGVKIGFDEEKWCLPMQCDALWRRKRAFPVIRILLSPAPRQWLTPFRTSGLPMYRKLYHLLLVAALVGLATAASGCNSLKDAWDNRGVPGQSEP